MAIWRGKSMHGSDGLKVHVEWEVFGGMKKHKNIANESVELARKYVNDAYNGLQGNTFQQLPEAVQNTMTKYFCFAGTPSTADYQEILNVINLTRNGLNSNDLKLKISNSKSTTSGGTTTTTVGYVKNYPKRDIRALTKKDWHKVPIGPKQGRHTGNIHVHQMVLQSNSKGSDTVIHEATHRYAGTSDFGEAGYVDSTLSRNFRAPGLTPAQALNNAESYASFVYWTGVFDEWNKLG